jgi:hypothetical protein
MIKQKKTKKKNVNVNQTVVVNIQKGKRNPRAKASAPQVMNAPQIIPPQVGSAYHQAVYGARAPAIPSMGSVPGYYAGMMSPFNAPLHIASEVQQAQLRQANELAGANLPLKGSDSLNPLQRPSLVSSEVRAPSGLRPMERPKPQIGSVQQSATAPIYRLPEREESMPGYGKQEAKQLSVPVSLTPQRPFAPTFSMEASEPASASASASASSSSMESPMMGSPMMGSPSEEVVSAPEEVNDLIRSIRITQVSLNELPYKRKNKADSRVFLTDIASSYGIPLPRSVVGKKADVINYLIQKINR